MWFSFFLFSSQLPLSIQASAFLFSLSVFGPFFCFFSVVNEKCHFFSENISTFMFYLIPGTRSIYHASNFSADECASVFCYYNIDAITHHNWAFSLFPLWYLHSNLHSHSLINFILNIFNLFSRSVWYTIQRELVAILPALEHFVFVFVFVFVFASVFVFDF